MRRRMRLALLLALLLPALPWALLWAPSAEGAGKRRDFWLSNLEGKRFDSRKVKDPYVISFFFVDCVPCLKEVPQLHALMTREYPGSALLFVDPIGEDSTAYVKDFADRVGVPYGFFYRDPLAGMAKKYFKGTMVFPTIVVVKDGGERYRFHDLSPESLGKIRRGLAK